MSSTNPVHDGPAADLVARPQRVARCGGTMTEECRMVVPARDSMLIMARTVTIMLPFATE